MTLATLGNMPKNCDSGDGYAKELTAVKPKDAA